MTTLGIDHLGLTVRNLAASRDFFVDCLGWVVFGGNSDYPASDVTNGHAKPTFWQLKDRTGAGFDRHRQVGLHHTAQNVPSEAELTSIYDHVKDWSGVEIDFAPEFSGPGPKVCFMVLEPGGTRLELSHDP